MNRNTSKKFGRDLMVAVLAVALSACGTTGANKAQNYAGNAALLAGGAALAFGGGKNKELNALIVAGVAGTVGYIVGNEMDKADKVQLNNVLETGRTRRKVAWVNPDTRARYEVTPQRAVRQSNGRVCRKVKIAVLMNGKPQEAYKRFCRDSYGDWVLQ